MEQGHCKCWAGKLIILGVLVLVWNWYLTGNFFAKDWPTFIGVVIAIKGIIKIAMPCCQHCECKEKPSEKKKK